MPIEVRLVSADYSALVLKELIERDVGILDGVVLKLEKPPMHVRGVDASVLTAVVASAGAAFGALITGLLGMAARRATKSIVIEDRHGRKVQYPADLPPEKVKELIALVAELERPIIRI